MTDADSLMTDTYGRRITDVRIAVNSACNLRCIYCHHEGEVVNGCVREECGEPLTKEELIEVLTVFRNMGVKTVKLTGGEPTLRPDLADIIRAIPEGMEISLTTNGTRLKDIAYDLKAAGLTRVNISLDTLNRDRYAKITGRDLLPDVLEGLKAALDAGLTPVKLNVVLLPGLNDEEVDDFLAFAREHDDVILQFIELMDVNGWTDGMQEGKSNAAFAAPSIATVATGIPVGIITVERRASIPSRLFDFIGIPITGNVVLAAIAPARCAAIPAAAIIAPKPFFLASDAKTDASSGVLCAEKICTS